jgi:hypothetical protein
MKYILPLIAAVLVLFVACQPPVTPGTPVVVMTVLGTGDTLQLSWTQVTDAQGYYVYLDGVKNTITALSHLVPAPITGALNKKIEVSSYNGSEESEKWTKSTVVTKTSSVTAYGIGAAPGNTVNAFGFNTTSGTCIAVDLVSEANWPNADFILEDRPPDNMSFWSPDAYTPHYNDKDNASAPSTYTDFDALKIAPGSGVYNTKNPISENAVYPIWIDPTNNGWSTDDHFGKVKIESIQDHTVVMTAGYQLIGGLRWIISE